MPEKNRTAIDIYKMAEKYSLSETEYHVLEYILKNIDMVLNQGVREVANLNYTSAATVIKLAKKMGFTGYVDMIYRLNFLLKSRKKHQEDTMGLTSFLTGLEEPAKLATDLLQKHQNHTIFITATGFSSPLADYFSRKMLVLGYRCIITNAYGVYDKNQIGGQLVIAISKSGETESITKVIDFAARNNLDILSFTGPQKNHIAVHSTVNVPVPDDKALDDRNITANYFYARVMIIFEFMMDQLSHKD